MPLHDTSYQHWQGRHIGVWGRRLVVAQHGIQLALKNRWMKNLVVLIWISSLAMALALFGVGQLLVADSVIAQATTHLNPFLQSVVQGLTKWLADHPEVSVRTTQNLLFFFYCVGLMRAAIFLLGAAIPVLITRDLASNAIIIYSSKALSRGDYLLGKFLTAFGLLSIAWLGPVITAWFVGNLLSPDWRFFWHSRIALGHAVIYGLAAMTFLSLIAMGISGISSKEKTTSGIWYVWWILGGVLVPIASQTRPWLRHLSFNFDLEQVALGIFRLGDDLKLAQDRVPVFGEILKQVPPKTMLDLNEPAMAGAVFAMTLMMIGAVVVVWRKVKTE